jgi:hypothetical protein
MRHFSEDCRVDSRWVASATLAGLTHEGLNAVASAINNVIFPDGKEEIKSLAEAAESIASD